MRHSLSTAGLLLALAGHVALALPSGSSNGVLPRDVAPFTIATSGPPFSIGQSPDDPARVAPIQLKQQTFLYGQSPTGTAPFFPAGPLGNATVYRDIVEDSAELAAQVQLVQADAVNATAAIIAVSSLIPRIQLCSQLKLATTERRLQVHLRLHPPLQKPMEELRPRRRRPRDVDKLHLRPALLHGTALREPLLNSSSAARYGVTFHP
jgi:hypothetical protein